MVGYGRPHEKLNASKINKNISAPDAAGNRWVEAGSDDYFRFFEHELLIWKKTLPAEML